MATAEIECDILTCPICLEKLKSPKSLPCSHSFCEVCIGEFILSTIRRTGHKLSSYHCPICRSVVTPTNPEDETSQWASSLPQNVTISAQMDQSESTKQECHLCKRQNVQNVATRWCRDCSEAFCDDCLRLHNLMKISADHKVIKIEDISKCASGGESDFCLISYKCLVHTSKILEAFCYDHQELCCVLCLTLQHRKCENIQAFEEITNLNTDGIESFESKLKEVKAKVKKIVEEKKNKHEKSESYFKDIELAAKTTAASIKDRIDVLLSSFLKELSIIGDEHKTVSKGKLKTAENLLSSVVSLMNSTKSVQDYGSLNQIFIHLNKSKSELKSKIVETNKILNAESVEEAIFALNGRLHQIEKEDRFGAIEVYCNVPIKANCNVPIELNEFMNVNTLDTGSIKNIKLRHKKTMSFAFDVNAICTMDNILLVGGGHVTFDDTMNGALNAVDCVTGACVANTTHENMIQSLACESPTIFVLNCLTISTFKLQEGIFKLHQEIELDDISTGGLCVFNEFMYCFTEDKLQKINIEKTDLQECFNIDSNYTKKNGLAIDIKNKRLLYTSLTDEVVAITTEGSEIFCYKDEHMKGIVAVTVNSQGCIIACGKNGTLHVISEDGRKRKTLCDKFDKIKEPSDICFDKSGKVLFVCGDQFVEEYEALY